MQSGIKIRERWLENVRMTNEIYMFTSTFNSSFLYFVVDWRPENSWIISFSFCFIFFYFSFRIRACLDTYFILPLRVCLGTHTNNHLYTNTHVIVEFYRFFFQSNLYIQCSQTLFSCTSECRCLLVFASPPSTNRRFSFWPNAKLLLS